MDHKTSSFSLQWFTRRGFLYRPAAPAGWIVLGLALAYLIWAFFDIDSRSHSVSDTLINWLFNVLLMSMAYSIIGYFTEKKNRGE